MFQLVAYYGPEDAAGQVVFRDLRRDMVEQHLSGATAVRLLAEGFSQWELRYVA